MNLLDRVHSLECKVSAQDRKLTDYERMLYALVKDAGGRAEINMLALADTVTPSMELSCNETSGKYVITIT